MTKCVVCGGAEFYTEAGFYFCKECQTQNEDIREEVLDVRVDTTTRLKKSRIRQDKSSISEQKLGWTTWEQYNFILIGLTNELVELGASSDIRMTVLQLWAYYLKKIEVAFTSTTKRSMPKLARNFNKRDAEIIYGKIAQRKKNRRRGASSATSGSSVISGVISEGSSNRDINKQKKRLVEAEYERFVQSQDSSEGDALSVMNQSLHSVQSSAGRSSAQTDDHLRFNKEAKRESAKVRVLSMKLPRLQRLKYRNKHVTTQYKIGPQTITPMKLWALIYLALRVHDERIHLADMLRYGREGHLSYYKLDHLLPPEVTLTRSETNLLHMTKEITHKGMRRTVASLAKFLEVWETRNPDYSMLLERYCVELQLPKGVMNYAERMMAMAPPKMIFDAKTACFPNYEGRVMGFIIVVMKILFGLDGLTEYEISRVIEKINSIASSRDVLDAKLFSFREWQRYIECRRCAIANLHFPTKLKFEPDAPGNHHLYLRFMADIKSKSIDRDEPEIKSYKHLLPRNLSDAMRACVDKLNDVAITSPREVDIFPPSLTPLHSYLQRISDDPDKDLPTILKMDNHSTKIGYATEPESLKTLAEQCGIDLKIRDAGLHFIEKIVRPFEQSNLPTIDELNKPVRVEDPVSTNTRESISNRGDSDDWNDYLNRKSMYKIYLDRSKFDDYENVRRSSRRRRRDFLREYNDDFGFDEILPNGKLAIVNDCDSDDESVRSVDVNDDDATLNTNDNEDDDDDDDDMLRTIAALSRCNVSLSNCEKKFFVDNDNVADDSFTSVRAKSDFSRDPVTGKFVKFDSTSKFEKIRKVSSNAKDRRNKFDDGIATVVDDDDDAAAAPAEITEIIELDSDYDFGLDDDDISILHDGTSNSNRNDTSGRSHANCESSNDVEVLFRPYTDFWMHRCNFSRVKQKNFRQLENNFSHSFRWLLTECASVVEMSEEDLYEEVCLIESYYADFFKPEHRPCNSNNYENTKYRTRTHYNSVKKKW